MSGGNNRAEPAPLGIGEILARASSALGKVDLHGRRGATMLSIDEAEAMALLLACLGLIPTAPGDTAPAVFFTPIEGPLK